MEEVGEVSVGVAAPAPAVEKITKRRLWVILGALLLGMLLAALDQTIVSTALPKIASDLHGLSMNAGLIDLPTTMSKFLAMGMPLREAILRTTWNPAQEIGHPELGHLSVGAEADVAVWSLTPGDFGFADAYGGRIRGKQRLQCEMTVRAGAIAWDWNARSATDYRKLGPGYGVREGIDGIIRPPVLSK